MPGLFDRLQTEIDQRERSEGLSPADLLDLSTELRRLVQTLTRKGDMTAAELGAAVGMPAAEVTPLLDALIDKGFVAVSPGAPEPRYKAALARRRGREVPFNIWEALTDRTTPGGPEAGSTAGPPAEAGSTAGPPAGAGPGGGSSTSGSSGAASGAGAGGDAGGGPARPDGGGA